MSSRIYFDESLNRNADEFLETTFFQLFHDSASEEDKAAFPTLLDPYTKICSGDAAISFTGAFDSIEKASRWSSQFGELRVWRGHDNKWWAKIGPDRRDESAVSHDKQLNVILLAGIQLLREYSIKILNPTLGEQVM
jgi:hypothetical protein